MRLGLISKVKNGGRIQNANAFPVTAYFNIF
jgi:hypothetical protein